MSRFSACELTSQNVARWQNIMTRLILYAKMVDRRRPPAAAILPGTAQENARQPPCVPSTRHQAGPHGDDVCGLLCALCPMRLSTMAPTFPVDAAAHGPVPRSC